MGTGASCCSRCLAFGSVICAARTEPCAHAHAHTLTVMGADVSLFNALLFSQKKENALVFMFSVVLTRGNSVCVCVCVCLTSTLSLSHLSCYSRLLGPLSFGNIFFCKSSNLVLTLFFIIRCLLHVFACSEKCLINMQMVILMYSWPIVHFGPLFTKHWILL